MSAEPSDDSVPSASKSGRFPARGALGPGRAEEVLKQCALVHFTGTLAFQAGGVQGVLPMLNGAPEVGEGDAHLERALDEFLALHEGRYSLSAMLPALDGATMEDDLGFNGALESVTVPELFRYCEQVGLTGTLTMTSSQAACVARFRHGELLSLTVDDEADPGFTQVFGWVRGSFAVTAQSAFESTVEADPGANVPGAAALLKTLEVAVTDILSRREAALQTGQPSMRPPSVQRGSSLPFGLTGAPKVMLEVQGANTSGSWRALAAESPHVDSTVKIYFVNKQNAEGSKETQHASVGGVEVLPLGGAVVPKLESGAAAVVAASASPEVPEPVKAAPAAPEEPLPPAATESMAQRRAMAQRETTKLPEEPRRRLDLMSVGLGVVLTVLLLVGLWSLSTLLK